MAIIKQFLLILPLLAQLLPEFLRLPQALGRLQAASQRHAQIVTIRENFRVQFNQLSDIERLQNDGFRRD